MSVARDRFRQLLGGQGCTLAAPVFDPLSARVAQLEGWQVAKLTGSVAKAVHLGLPDQVAVANMTDLAEICRRICRAAEVSLIVDADDGGGEVLNVRRTVEDLEAAGVSAIELEDSSVPLSFEGVANRHARLFPVDLQAARLRSAVAARRDPGTVIAARTHIFSFLPADEASQRVAVYAKTGVDALMMSGYPGREAVRAAHEASGLPVFIVGLPADVVADTAFLRENQVRVRYGAQLPYHLVVRAIQSGLRRLAAGEELADLGEEALPESLMAEIAGTAGYRQWEERFRP